MMQQCLSALESPPLRCSDNTVVINKGKCRFTTLLPNKGTSTGPSSRDSAAAAGNHLLFAGRSHHPMCIIRAMAREAVIGMLHML